MKLEGDALKQRVIALFEIGRGMGREPTADVRELLDRLKAERKAVADGADDLRRLLARDEANLAELEAKQAEAQRRLGEASLEAAIAGAEETEAVRKARKVLADVDAQRAELAGRIAAARRRIAAAEADAKRRLCALVADQAERLKAKWQSIVSDNDARWPELLREIQARVSDEERVRDAAQYLAVHAVELQQGGAE